MTEAEVIATDDNGKAAGAEDPKPIVVDEVDRLRAELMATKHQNVTNQVTILQLQVNELQRAQQALLDSIMAHRQQLEQKYGINLQTHQVQADSGVVIPRPGAHPGLAGMLPR